MNFIKNKVNDQLDAMYDESELTKEEVNQEIINKIINLARMPLPDFLLEIINEGLDYGFEIKDEGVIIQFLQASEILAMDDNYPFFRKQMKTGIIFATDLGDSIYYFADGKDGIGIYIVGDGVGDFYQDAIKLSNTFEEFLIEGTGLETLIKWNNNTL